MIGNSGTFASDNYPGAFTRGRDCVWMLESEPGMKIELSFQDIDIDDTNNCSSDAIMVSTFLSILTTFYSCSCT